MNLAEIIAEEHELDVSEVNQAKLAELGYPNRLYKCAQCKNVWDEPKETFPAVDGRFYCKECLENEEAVNSAKEFFWIVDVYRVALTLDQMVDKTLDQMKEMGFPEEVLEVARTCLHNTIEQIPEGFKLECRSRNQKEQ